MDRLLSMQVFERVVDAGGFAAAARAMDLSPPVVTRLVADLEAFLGARLVNRSTRRLSLTEAGASYLARVRSILQEIDEAHALARAHTLDMEGTLRVHSPPVLASYVVAPLLAEFRRRYPLIRIDVDVETTSKPPFEDYDLTLLGTDESYNGDIVARRVVVAEAILVASPAYLAARGAPAEPAALKAHDALRLKASKDVPQLWRLWRVTEPDQAVEVAVRPVLTANHTDTLLRACMDGAGITSVSMDIVAPYLTRGELVRVLAPWITGRLAMYAALPSRRFVPRRTRTFLDFLLARTRAQAAQALAACGGA